MKSGDMYRALFNSTTWVQVLAMFSVLYKHICMFCTHAAALYVRAVGARQAHLGFSELDVWVATESAGHLGKRCDDVSTQERNRRHGCDLTQLQMNMYVCRRRQVGEGRRAGRKEKQQKKHKEELVQQTAHTLLSKPGGGRSRRKP